MNDDQIEAWREDNRRARDSGPPISFLVRCALLPWSGTKEVPWGTYRLIAEDLGTELGSVVRVARAEGYSSPRDPELSKKAALLEVMAERFPDKVAQRGAWGALAEEMGLSRGYVARVASAAGYRSERTGAPERKRVERALRRRFPGRRYPRGQLKEMAREYGISYIYIQQIARRIGLRSET